MNVPFLDLQAQYRTLKEEIDPAIHQILDTSAYILGPAVEGFEKNFAAFCGAKHCIGMNSGTAAIALLLQAHGIGPGDEVITVANSFFASAEAVSEIGATPVFVDCRLDDALMDPTLLEAAITSRTKAILPVHLYGTAAPMNEILEIAKKHDLLVFEDAAQAQGTTYKGKRAGTLADGACFSYYPGKNLGAYGEAGSVVTQHDDIAAKLKMLREHGSPKKYEHECVGWNERMDGIQGAVLGVKLKHLEKWNTLRRKHAAQYREMLAHDDRITVIPEPSYGESIVHLFVVRVQNREAVQAALHSRGVATGIHYPHPLPYLPAYASLGYKKGQFPASETLCSEILSLPMYPELTEDQVTYVVESLRQVL